MFRVAIVDDDELMREALKMMISARPEFKVTHLIKDGETAVRICKEEDWDLLIMDVVLPGMTGLESGTMILKEKKNIELWILSLLENKWFEEKLSGMNVARYLTKPVSKKKLNRFLDEYAQSHTTFWLPNIDTMKEMMGKTPFVQKVSWFESIAEDILKTEGMELQNKKEAFGHMGEMMFKSAGVSYRRDRFDKQFPVSLMQMKSQELMKLWLSRILDYLCKQQSIKRYVILEHVFCYIDANICEDISLGQITEHCSVSQGYLSRIFRERFGISVMEYIRIRKIQIVKEYLLTSNKKIGEIADLTGVCDGSYLSKMFQKMTGVPIKKYREQYHVE